ncbi:phosphoribosylaminoimidazolesuccinocarboxamide synthase [Catellatospora tritici]|uniref:phosphoribosylaminoimidazolesuccinocarboxamide synthase n=1 Tax=Catellatospora tritici TaxID=2851566 RepID=UPI001C2D3799|nr:phosphoribosylaminoimidazolesuccinocarboxamide synthase [Catellatospora tritici]MBV1849981.1 phosphoribosylaminoimidazolesuccinocarboxamide synthase [Catellatospora tritici]
MAPQASDSPLMDNCLTDAEFSELPGFSRNKVRDAYQLPDRRRLLISTDRQSAFDQVLAAVPYKGQVLTQTARYWFDETADICPNHVISYPDPSVVMVKDLDMLPIEIVVRAYLTGSTNTSAWPMYARGERVLYGHEFPEGLKKNQKLPKTIITPTTKPAQGGHDAPITEAEILETQLVTAEQWQELAERSLALFARGQELAAKKGLILVDTKYEFGLDENGAIVVADEIHTPDSSRYWIAETYQQRFEAGEEPDSLDKEFLRLWIVSQCDPYKDPIPEIPTDTLIEFSNKYIALYEQLTGLDFEKPDPTVSVRARIREALAKELPEYF